jgi:hypothetical protein
MATEHTDAIAEWMDGAPIKVVAEAYVPWYAEWERDEVWPELADQCGCCVEREMDMADHDAAVECARALGYAEVTPMP